MRVATSTRSRQTLELRPVAQSAGLCVPQWLSSGRVLVCTSPHGPPTVAGASRGSPPCGLCTGVTVTGYYEHVAESTGNRVQLDPYTPARACVRVCVCVCL